MVEESDYHWRDAAAVSELMAIYIGEADVVATLGSMADGGGGATCRADYDEFPVDDKRSTCVWSSLVAWSCHAGSRPVSHPDLGGANACLHRAFDLRRPDGACRENYAKALYQGRDTCRWAEMNLHKAPWYTLAREHGVARPQKPIGSTTVAPGETLRECAECPRMVSVPAGTFTMGARASEPLSFPVERPQRTVSVPLFAASVFEVTFAEWDACVAAGGCGGYRPDDAGWGRANRPVINLDWNDAQRYVAWLSRRTGQTYRLLTEAEWEFAARAGTTTPFHTGRTISPRQANYDGRHSYPNGRYNASGLYRAQTLRVGSFAANGFGLYDMHGNVWEWVQDCFGSYRDAPVDGSAVEHEDCVRILRSGAWDFSPRDIRSATRGRLVTDGRYNDIGLRVARTFAP